MSSFREFQLLSDDKTDYISSLKNIALDAVGAGVGGVAGAKGEVIIGSFFGPIGTAIGGGIGAVIGAIGGRMATNKAKRIPLDNAIKAYETGYYQMKNETEAKSKDTLISIQTFAENKREEFKESEILEDIPVSDCSSVAEQIAFILYQFIVNEVIEMKRGVSQIKKSIWYSAKKYDAMVFEYEQQIEDIEKFLLPTILIVYHYNHGNIAKLMDNTKIYDYLDKHYLGMYQKANQNIENIYNDAINEVWKLGSHSMKGIVDFRNSIDWDRQYPMINKECRM